MKNTYARPLRDLRNNYSEIIDLVNAGNQVIITKNGRETAVVIGTEAYRDFEAFLHQQRTNEALADAESKAMRKSDLLLTPTLATKGWRFDREEANER